MALLTLKAINSELTKRGHNARLEKASDFFIQGGEATDSLTGPSAFRQSTA
jgi:hypothetical protein